jgi:hypothetical protein
MGEGGEVVCEVVVSRGLLGYLVNGYLVSGYLVNCCQAQSLNKVEEFYFGF